MILLKTKDNFRNLFFLLCITYLVVNRLLWNSDIISFNLSITIQSVLCLFSLYMCLLDESYNRVLRFTPLAIWLLWIVYIGFQGLFLHFEASIYFKALFCFFLMSLVAYMSYKDFHNTIKYLVIVMYITMIASLIILPAILAGMRDEEGGNINWAALIAVFGMFFVLLLALSEKWTVLKTVMWIVLPIVIIIMCGSRKAFGGMVIEMLAYIFIKIKSNNANIKIGAFFLGVILAVLFYYVLEDSVIGDRIRGMGDANFTEYYATGTFWDKFDDRGIMYYYGIELFKEQPVFGIGLGNFKYHFVIEQTAHSEYIVQFCECGIIGLLLFLLFYSRIIKSLMRFFKHGVNLVNKQTLLYLISGIIMVLFLSFSTWFYSSEAWACFIGLIIGYNSRRSKKIVQYSHHVAN